MKVTIRATVDAVNFGTDEELADLTDEQIVDLLQADTSALFHGATWELEREG